MGEWYKSIVWAVLGAFATELAWPPRGEATRDRAIAAARRVQDVTGWKHFDCFVDRTAWAESRYNPRAGAYWEENAARGLFQIRPKTARAHELSWIPLWSSPELQVALAADLANRAIQNWGAKRWVDVRAYWAYPRIADATAEENERRALVEKRWKIAGENTMPCPGIDDEDVRNYTWPGGGRIVSAALGIAK